MRRLDGPAPEGQPTASARRIAERSRRRAPWEAEQRDGSVVPRHDRVEPDLRRGLIGVIGGVQSVDNPQRCRSARIVPVVGRWGGRPRRPRRGVDDEARSPRCSSGGGQLLPVIHREIPPTDRLSTGCSATSGCARGVSSFLSPGLSPVCGQRRATRPGSIDGRGVAGASARSQPDYALYTDCGQACGRALLGSAGLLFDPVGQLGDLVVDRAPFGHQLSDLLVGVHDRGVVTSAELLPDLG